MANKSIYTSTKLTNHDDMDVTYGRDIALIMITCYNSTCITKYDQPLNFCFYLIWGLGMLNNINKPRTSKQGKQCLSKGGS